MLSKAKWTISAGVIFFACWLILMQGEACAADGRNSFEKIESAFLAGNIDRSEMLFEQVKALFAPQNLSSNYKSDSPSLIKSGTEIVMQVLDNWDNFDAEQQELMSSLMSRPSMDHEFDSPSGFFKIHYDTVPPEAVPPEDIDGDDVPDYVERIAQYCDSSYFAFSGMGYLPPPGDGSVGGDSKYDIYLTAIAAYGVTIPDGNGDSVWNDARSHIWIHHSFNVAWLSPNDDPAGDTIGAQKVTSAHEFFHAVQLAYVYSFTEYQWLMEITSTWMEEVVFPEVNDNYNYLPYFFSEPYETISSTSGLHMYGAFVWAAFLEQKFDYTVILKMWEAARYNLAFDATDSALSYFGTDIKSIFPEFTVWNYFTGDRAIPGMYYAEAADYPQVDIDQSFTTLAHDSIQPINAPQGLACNYVQFDIDTSARGVLDLILEGSILVRWSNSGIISDVDDDTTQTQTVDGSDPIHIYLPFIEDYSTVTAIPAVIMRFQTGNDYHLSCRILPYGDANNDGETNVGDATYLIRYVFFSDPPPAPVLEIGDANCDGGVNVADAVRIINYVFRGGDEPCAERIPQ
jgi:hypothetical protein